MRAYIDALCLLLTDVDLVAAQFDLVRHIRSWIAATTLQQRALERPPSMTE